MDKKKNLILDKIILKFSNGDIVTCNSIDRYYLALSNENGCDDTLYFETTNDDDLFGKYFDSTFIDTIELCFHYQHILDSECNEIKVLKDKMQTVKKFTCSCTYINKVGFAPEYQCTEFNYNIEGQFYLNEE